ncbi:MarR family winged helix-turn-helix transcriptional regulator [Streptococcus uberis]|uniref:MarR family regulatory protein n=1 Tax=Streptococcus uberis (strain ATCC BAA-854 / 0140J) TaxID=218495 RepID=B9DS35_STRU0|nr:helix-turn-helix domain-containing protein [Streptococcus uberis]KKF41899.1 MarR family transcriptional regulator [Streptococcus uberis Ab71]KKF42922.1 MarR family transcriptional regulator [Streptococcus uberis C9359]KKF43924.1 MarR family transcriptional regulator [Streptococcus uberis EF20/0145]KKF50265.1 MarR family transcriptional regulator [Streptococcus uberis S6261]KKF52948.1 MarR family transcriptional regulator [Streptococcus uberis C5388]
METVKIESKKIVRILDQQKSIYENYAKENGLQGRSLQLLLWIYYNQKGVSQSYLVEKTLLSKQVVNATIQVWQKKGYVELVSTENDKRQKLVKLTEKGNQISKKILDPLETVEVRALSTLSYEERQLFQTLFSRYTQALKKEMEAL